MKRATQTGLAASLCLFLIIFTEGVSSAGGDDNVNFCSRIPGSKRLVSFWIGGLRADILENYTSLLPNFQRLLDAGISASCPTFSSATCARSILGNRYAPNPIDFRILGAFNITNEEEEANFNATYHWTTFSGFASVATGIDTPTLKLNGFQFSDGAAFVEALSKTSGTFLSQVKKKGFVTAVTGTPSVLTSLWSSGTAIVTPGVLDYECGITSTGFPDIDPSATSSCNMDYRRAITEEEFLSSSDSIGADFVNTLVKRRCADVIVYHMNALEHAMHEFGIGSVEYVQALVSTDALIGSVLDSLEKIADVYKYNYFVITTSDHGGAEIGVAPYFDFPERGDFLRLDYGSNWLRDEAVPFILSSIGPSGIPFTSLSSAHNYDFTPTALHYLDVSVPNDLDGVVQGFPRSESGSSSLQQITICLQVLIVMIVLLIQ